MWEYLTHTINAAQENVDGSLNAFGRLGWELVSFERGDMARIECVFKRPLVKAA